MSTAAQIQQHLSPASFAKYVAIRRRILSHNPLVIRPLRAFDRAVLSATQYQGASR
jgi:hypothetical protein